MPATMPVTPVTPATTRTDPPAAGRRGQAGSATLLVVGVVALTVVVIAGSTRLGDAVLRQQRVQAVADVTALAGAVGGRSEASRVAQRNRAAVVAAATAADGAFGVTVRRDGVAASAAATRG